ncbi:MAG: DeoR/GlpR family DNA-binding transcription regulator [Clostridium sp.]|jgi:DeoR family myo-inositol catabolism operon transcriptional repressor|uniref:DeoR/GlpR family DNA-binding transcription regulator n=1 Tax=Clostridium sp. TaxID=1506 RepID=UPI0025BD4EFD|nr:DeoR/GlpR family DNA-binding transcription regulator [Clostridium sp.]MCH3965787.1 DeoR/GlpR family DNA-binding transcription regulator [Clostridium sp.]MCI1717321.1 DeoR/GlpR family DNA-binding transcription regulator [Clostridium sp.]MCI1801661.1 DeoR/GlpR family DNA-binding transcription regulator [Clostridium sp.]MCI1815507.1 DeoR/GlpR family DNA-binding transcription regulator [Clostridium sp.]MCI1872394.1 DeoR/GlpR family DNA-binding transcription regulator [Clostridium sp.]
MKLKRIQKIEEYILDNNTVTLDKLADVFNVSKNTIRRDINELVEKGTIKKVYGGVSVNSNPLVPFDKRQIKNIYSKSLIAEEAAKLIEDGDIIFVDSGTTTLNLADFLKDKKNITIITNNLNFINKCIKYNNLNIISTGGSLVRKTNSLVGTDTLNMIKKYNINKAFMASTGISLASGVTNGSPQECEIKKLVVSKSNLVYVLIDHSKFGISSLMTYCSMEDIDYLITDKKPPEEYIQFIKRNNVNLIIAQNDKCLYAQG